MTLDEFLKESRKDPDFKREYDALEGWYQEELAKQEALDRIDDEKRRQDPTPSIYPLYAWYWIRLFPVRRATMLEYKGYHATVSFDEEDGLFVGEVFGINDSLNFHGRSINELNVSFHDCIDNYLDICETFRK